MLKSRYWLPLKGLAYFVVNLHGFVPAANHLSFYKDPVTISDAEMREVHMPGCLVMAHLPPQHHDEGEPFGNLEESTNGHTLEFK